MNLIRIENLSKHFVINKRQSGIGGVIKSMFKPERLLKKAVDSIDMQIAAGEIVGFIGPNGAGKSTTIKMLTGILVPTAGTVEVGGIVPYKQRKAYTKNIGVVFGQRTQLWWNLPVDESFDLLRTIYRIPRPAYQKNIELFTEVLGIDEFLHMPVRQLSLGQRMRCEIAASLLHNPKVVFLDEPTIGLDVVAKERIREFIAKINRETGVTVILTTHDMSDIEKLCKRIVIIDLGKIIYDGNIDEIKDRFGKDRMLVVDFDEPATIQDCDLHTTMKTEGLRRLILFNRDKISAIDLITKLSAQYKINDFALQETEIDNIIRHIYENKTESAAVLRAI
ncbi:MAG: ATP-binding cassette domain-containing protein [Bacillota bacterium]